MVNAGPTRVKCPRCGAPHFVVLPESVNARRQPELREQILAGTFMRFMCDQCGEPSVIERQLLYTDIDARLFIGIFPSERRSDHEACARVIETALHQAAQVEAPAEIRAEFADIEPRVCFGYAELREKIACATAGLDDRIVEAVKLIILDGIPGAPESRVRGLLLVDVDDDGTLIFAQRFNRPMSPDDLMIRVDRLMYDDLARDEERLKPLIRSLLSRTYVQAEIPDPWS